MLYNVVMAQRKKRIKAPTTDKRMLRVNQRAHKFVDRKKEGNKKFCRTERNGDW